MTDMTSRSPEEREVATARREERGAGPGGASGESTSPASGSVPTEDRSTSEPGTETDAQRGSTPEQERAEARKRRAVSATVVHEAIRFEGEDQLTRGSMALFWSGLAAGLAMGFSLVGEGVLHAALPDTPWRLVVESLGYTLGFVFVVMGRQQLFTENTLTPVLPVLLKPSKLPAMLRLWAIVLVANLIGAVVFAWVAESTSLFQPEVKAAFAELARHVLEPSAGILFLRAIVAGWLIALMVWLLPAAEHARLAIIVLTTYVIAVTHMAHSIAGSIDVLYLVFSGAATWADYARFASIAIVGNIIGGVTIVALLNHGQVVAGE